MKQIYSTVFLILSFCFLWNPISAQNSCTITYDGRQGNLKLSNGEVFCIPAGETFSGRINSVANGAIIKVDPLAVFAPIRVNQMAGTIENEGKAIFGKSLNLMSGAKIINGGEMRFEKSLNVNGVAQIENQTDAILSFTKTTSLQRSGASLVNDGAIYFQQLNTGSGFSIINRGRMETGRINLGNPFDNYGFLLARADVNINSSAEFTNSCTFYLEGRCNNNSSKTVNEGFIWLNSGAWQNNANFLQAEEASMRGVDFTNNASVSGGGDFYFSGTTRNNGQFGTDRQGINFYDTGNPGQIMDFAYGTIDPSVSSQAFSPADTTSWSATCDPRFLDQHVGYHYLGTYNSQGLPDYLVGKDPISQDFLEMVHKALPERAPVPQYNPDYLERKYDRDIKLKENAEVWVSFVAEGAGYKNVLGFYVYDTIAPPTTPPAKEDITIIFPNVSAKYSGGELEAGHKVKLGDFRAGQGIGWVLMANGWKNGTVTEGNWTLFSNPDFNPEKDRSLREHNVLLFDA
ncbi:MAG: DUF4114 domain-containing protein, partial [Bacteroidota bacterium]